MAEAERVEARQIERPAPQAVAVAAAERAGLGDVAERIRTLVAVGLCVFRAAAADRIENDEDRAGHDVSYWLTTLSSVASLLKAAANSARV